MDEFIQRQPAGATNLDPVLIPSVRPDLAIHLADHERVEYRGRADVTMLRYDQNGPGGGTFRFLWNLVETAELLITNERLIYRANTLSRTPGTLAGLREGLSTALSGRQQLPLRPDAYVGQIRFGWIDNVAHGHFRKLGSTIEIVTITAYGRGHTVVRLHLTFGVNPDRMPSPVAGPLATALTSAAARHRLIHSASTLTDTDTDTQALTSQRDTPRGIPSEPDVLRFDLPGATRPQPAHHVPPDLPPLPVLLVALNHAIDTL